MSNVSFSGAFLLLTSDGKNSCWTSVVWRYKRDGVKTLQKGKYSTSGCRPWLTNVCAKLPIRELKHKRFWNTDDNRKLSFSLVGAFSRHRVVTSSHSHQQELFPSVLRSKTTSKKETLDFQLPSVTHKRLCLSSLINYPSGRTWANISCSSSYSSPV